MRALLATAFAVGLAFGSGQAIASASSGTVIQCQEFQHGGGCRKSSPPGQCCHMDNSTGTVHCH